MTNTRPGIEETLDAYDQVSRNEALRALTRAAQYDPDNPDATPRVSGAVGDQVTPWALATARRLVSHATVLAWDPGLDEADGHGLLVVTDTGALYRFATNRPTDLPTDLREPLPGTGRRLQVVREAS